MNYRDIISIPLTVATITAPNWISALQTFWSIILPIGGAILVCLQIAYYWKMLRK